MFLLNMKSPGVEIRPIRQMNEASGFNEVYFTNVRIPDSQRLGAVNDGWRVSLTTLMNERLSIGSGMQTGADDLFDYCTRLALPGGLAIDDGRVRTKLASFITRSRGLKYTALRTISQLSKGEEPGPENSVHKLVAGLMVQDIAKFALDLEGEAGMLLDEAPENNRFQAMLMRSPAMRIEGGSDEILRNIIAERVLGLPGDIRVDKDVPFDKIPTSGRK
jgi:alkylation response protein AidB-like acyl-CoA dehydrogenase